MSATPAVTVIVPALNAGETLNDLLVALKAQAGLPGPFEIIVVDNGSTDGTLEIARAHGVTLLQQPVRGPSAARNLGLARAKTGIVACTDADTVPTRRWLVSLLSAFEDAGTMQATGPIYGWQPSTAAERFASARKIFDCEHTAHHPRHPFAHGMNLAVRRAAAAEIGGWEETMLSGEDVDFSLRIRKKFGGRIRFVEQAVLFHKHRCTDEALWKQARWHGAGYALVRQRHPELVPWARLRLAGIRASLLMLDMAAPFVGLARATRIISEQRAEFERYHRRWAHCFWNAFFEQRRKLSA